MLKKTFSIFFIIFLLIITILTPITASAYEVTNVNITAKQGLLASLDTGEFLYSNNIDQKVYPASLTKIMTVLLMLESDKYDKKGKVKMTKEALELVLGTGSAVSNMKEGEEFTQEDLLHLVLMSSFGDCALLAADFYGGSIENFVDMMNAKAKKLGLKNTVYLNPTGLHEDGHYTTVRDIYTLTLYALKNKTFKEICEKTRYVMPATNFYGERKLTTTNYLQDPNTNYYYQYASGVKTGYTDPAGRCLVSTASYKGYNYICILMGCPPKADKRYEFVESANLYRWAFNNFSFKEVANSEEPVCEIPVDLSFDTDFVPLYFEKPFVTILPNEADDSTIVVKTHFNSEVAEAPIKKGDVLGYAEIIYAEKVIGKVPLVAGANVKQNFLLVIGKFIKNIFTSTFMKIVYVAIALVIIGFIIMCIKLNIKLAKKRKVKYIPYEDENDDKYRYR